MEKCFLYKRMWWKSLENLRHLFCPQRGELLVSENLGRPAVHRIPMRSPLSKSPLKSHIFTKNIRSRSNLQKIFIRPLVDRRYCKFYLVHRIPLKDFQPIERLREVFFPKTTSWRPSAQSTPLKGLRCIENLQKMFYSLNTFKTSCMRRRLLWSCGSLRNFW